MPEPGSDFLHGLCIPYSTPIFRYSFRWQVAEPGFTNG